MKKILISNEPWQIRAAVIENNILSDIQFQASGDIELERSFFKGKIQRILPGIQTAFVEIHCKKAGFLHITEVDRSCAYQRLLTGQDLEESDDVDVPEKPIASTPDISNIFTEGQEVLVQVIKEPIFEKGAKLSTCFTIPGKFCVLMANIPHIGVSRKIENREERARLKEIASNCLEQDMGVIIRTTAEGRSELDIKRDLQYLIATWREIQDRFRGAKVGEKLHQDLPLALRMIREHLDDQTAEVIFDNSTDFDISYAFLKKFMPEQVSKLTLYSGKTPFFEHFGVEKQIDELLEKKVTLKSGGSLIIETTEAMTVIDVNSGKYVGNNKLEDTVFKINMEAAEEVVRQLRLRNIGGIIVIDFIDMSSFSNKNKLCRLLEKTLKERDKLKSVALKVSEFGIVQMTRKRTGKTIVQQLAQSCGNCQAKGFVKSEGMLSYQVLRGIKKELATKKYKKTEVQVSEEVFNFLSSDVQASLIELEKLLNTKIILGLCEKYKKAQFSIKQID